MAHTPNVKCQHAAIRLPPVKLISLNSKATNLFSVLFFRSWQEKKSCCFTSKLTKYGMIWGEIFVFLEHAQYPGHSSPVCLSEAVGFWWIPPSRAVSHTALCEETICQFEVERSCAERSQATCLPPASYLILLSLICVIIKAELWHELDFPCCVSLIFISSDQNLSAADSRLTCLSPAPQQGLKTASL